MIYTDWHTVPPDMLSKLDILPRKVGKRVGNNRRRYLNIVAAFDIETSRESDDLSWMYVWQLQIGINDTIIGRTWEDFSDLCRRLISDLDDDIYLVCFVHNLSYELQFLKNVYDFKQEEVFAVDDRRPLRCDLWGHIEMRCSYLHSNMRLETYLEKMGVEHQKTVLDYDKIRYPWTDLNDAEMLYCVNDVRGLVEAVYKEMAHDGDTLYTIPATSTGYVRRDVKAAMRKVSWKWIHAQLPDMETFDLLRRAFRGGNTHANRHYAKQILKGKYAVRSVDMTSAYPAAQLLDEFPIGPFRRAANFTMDYFNQLRGRRKKAVLIDITFINIRLKNRFEGCPYLAEHKCLPLIGAALDNGRILSADSARTVITELDFEIVEDMYTWDDEIIHYMEYARKGYLPQALKDCIMQYFEIKTKEKGLMRDKAKNKLNAIYGMSATNPVKDNIIYVDGKWKPEGIPAEKLLEDANKKAFFPYQWGVWTTANVRKRLHEGIRLIESQGGEFVYCDTDSIKYIGEADLSPINRPIIDSCIAGCYYADKPDGSRAYVGVFEDEGQYEEFATRGAKKYAYIKEGKLHATIAGVPTREDDGHISGGQFLESLGGLESFLLPKVDFENKLKIKYNDNLCTWREIEGHVLHIGPCATISPTKYTLKDTPEYGELVEISTEALYHFRRDILGIYD